MVYRFALRGANVVTANAHRGLPPAAEPACLPAGNPLTRVAGRNGYRPCFAGAREEARTGGGRHPDTADQNHRGARHRPSDHEELSDIGILVLSAHVEIGHAMADRISRVGDFSICVLSPSARSTANGSPTPRIRSPRPIGPLATATTCRSCGPSSSWTQMLDTPISGRIFLEQVIRDNLDIGRPDQVGFGFDPRPIRRGPRATPGRFPDQGDHRRGHPEPARGRQTHHDQAVRECPAHRDHHHRHQRFRDRETTDESARAAGDRRHRQPAPARRPTNRPRPDHRGPIPAHRHRTRHHRDRHPHPRAAPGVSGAAMPCSPRCRCFGSNPTASPTRSPPIDRRTAGSTTRHGRL